MSKKTTKKASAPAADKPVVVEAFKGFDANWQCRGFQYAVGESYTHDGEVLACNSGFHSCENPLDVFGYYEPGISKFAIVEASGAISREVNGDSKIASAHLTIKAELSLPDIIGRAIAWVTAHCSPADSHHATGNSSASSATGYRSASSATGDSSASSATGYSSASSATGDSSASSATGNSSASSVEGVAAVAMNIGRYGKARAGKDGAIVLCFHNDDGTLRHIRASKVGENGIKPGVFYMLSDAGEFEEAA